MSPVHGLRMGYSVVLGHSSRTSTLPGRDSGTSQALGQRWWLLQPTQPWLYCLGKGHR
jgi:hypothetical protein